MPLSADTLVTALPAMPSVPFSKPVKTKTYEPRL